MVAFSEANLDGIEFGFIERRVLNLNTITGMKFKEAEE